MNTVDTLVIGGGQAGLAMSRCLTDRGRDHVVLERGRLAERWRSERWDSMRLLSPNWMTRLPGWSYRGPEPDGFMTAHEVASFLEGYGRASAAPVEEHTAVRSVAPDGDRFRIETDRGRWSALDVVMATGWCDRPAIPACAGAIPAAVAQVAPRDYRNPTQLADGGVLVVGASATGVQLASELHASGRDVTLAVGRHTRLPRRYRGMEILWWLERLGRFDDTVDRYDDPARARRQPSLQLAGRADGRTLDLTTLRDAGVRLTGRLRAVDGATVELAGDLEATTARADDRLRRVLDGIDRHVVEHGLEAEVLAPGPPARRAAVGHRAPARPRPGADPHGHLGDRPPAVLPVAAGAGARRSRRDRAVPGRHAVAGAVRAGPALPAPPQLGLHRRGRP